MGGVMYVGDDCGCDRDVGREMVVVVVVEGV